MKNTNAGLALLPASAALPLRVAVGSTGWSPPWRAQGAATAQIRSQIDLPRHAWLAASSAANREVVEKSDELVIMAAGRVVHHSATAAPATHAVLPHVVDHRLQLVSADGHWLTLPNAPVPDDR